MPAHLFSVEMTCEGCSNALNRILTKQLKEGETFDVDLPGKKVTINSPDRSKEELIEILKKSGKAVSVLN